MSVTPKLHTCRGCGSGPSSQADTIAAFLNSVHSATLGKGKSDDTVIKIKAGDMDNKGELAMVFGKQVSLVAMLGLLMRKKANDM